MVSIQLSGGSLDIYKQDIQWSWTTVRFSEGIRDPYSNDFDIPRTANNVALLNACGLLDSREQPLGGHISPCVLSMDETLMDAYMEVVSVDDEQITVCLYEKTFPEGALDKTVGSLVKDTDDTIYVWNTNSEGAYPEFRKYFYGMGYNKNYAQYHPSKDLNYVIQSVNSALGINVPNSPSARYAVATKKTVCPQNRVQVIEGHWTSESGNYAVLNGGQNITNDCEFSYSPSNTTVTFNRDCKVKGRFFYSYKKKSTVTNDFTILVLRYDEGQTPYSMGYTIPSHLWASLVLEDSFTAVMHEGSQLRVMCNDTNKYDMLNFVLYLEIDGYDITDDDYGIELKYVGRTPRIKVWSDDGMFKFGSHGWRQLASTSGGYTYCFFDATTYSAHTHFTGHPNQTQTQDFTLRWCSLAYFGFWCNLPEITVKDLMFGSCWADGKKLVNSYAVNVGGAWKTLEYRDANDAAVIDGRVKSIRPSSDKLGAKNYILMSGQGRENAEPVSEIDNRWLESGVNLHESPFAWCPKRYGTMYCLYQYSNPSQDPETGEYKCDFEEIEGFAVANAGSIPTMLFNFTLDTMGFERVVQSVEVDIETPDDVKNLDFVFLEGRKYMVVEGQQDLNTGMSEIKAVLMPFVEDMTDPVNPWQPEQQEEQYPNDREPSYPSDPNDDFDSDSERPTYDEDYWDYE